MPEPLFGQRLVNPIVTGEIKFTNGPTQTTVGAAGGASALPATPTGYLRVEISGTEFVIPFYAVA